MISSEKHNAYLYGIFYSYFHNIEGPKLAVQYPQGCMPLDTFNNISDYVITKDQLCGCIMRVAVDDIEVVGFPVQISSPHYIRNSFNFNLCFVVKKGTSKGYESMVKKIALKLEHLEREKEYLQRPDAILDMEILIQNVYTSLKENNNCDIWIDPFTRLILFPIIDNKKLNKPVYIPQDYEVPFLRYSVSDIIRLLPDTIMFENLLLAIDGVRCVYELRYIADMAEMQLRSCLSFLLEVGAISLIDIFDICNIYVLIDFEAIWKPSMLQELLEYSRIRLVISPGFLDHKRMVMPSHVIPVDSTVNVEANTDKVTPDDMRALLSLFHYNVSIIQIIQNPIFAKIRNIIDIHRFVVFCCVNKILRRIYVYPVISMDATSFFLSFGNTLKDVKKSVGSQQVGVGDEYIGMSMDSSGGVGSKRYEEDEELGSIEIRRTSAKRNYMELFTSYHCSIFHSSEERMIGMSRHSSCLSFHQDFATSIPCSCKPNVEQIKKMVSKHHCLENIALHCDCCIPSVMKCLEERDDIAFLKLYVNLLSTQIMFLL